MGMVDVRLYESIEGIDVTVAVGNIVFDGAPVVVNIPTSYCGRGTRKRAPRVKSELKNNMLSIVIRCMNGVRPYKVLTIDKGLADAVTSVLDAVVEVVRLVYMVDNAQLVLRPAAWGLEGYGLARDVDVAMPGGGTVQVRLVDAMPSGTVFGAHINDMIIPFIRGIRGATPEVQVLANSIDASFRPPVPAVSVLGRHAINVKEQEGVRDIYVEGCAFKFTYSNITGADEEPRLALGILFEATYSIIPDGKGEKRMIGTIDGGLMEPNTTIHIPLRLLHTLVGTASSIAAVNQRIERFGLALSISTDKRHVVAFAKALKGLAGDLRDSIIITKIENL